MKPIWSWGLSKATAALASAGRGTCKGLKEAKGVAAHSWKEKLAVLQDLATVSREPIECSGLSHSHLARRCKAQVFRDVLFGQNTEASSRSAQPVAQHAAELHDFNV